MFTTITSTYVQLGQALKEIADHLEASHAIVAAQTLLGSHFGEVYRVSIGGELGMTTKKLGSYCEINGMEWNVDGIYGI